MTTMVMTMDATTTPHSNGDQISSAGHHLVGADSPMDSASPSPSSSVGMSTSQQSQVRQDSAEEDEQSKSSQRTVVVPSASSNLQQQQMVVATRLASQEVASGAQLQQQQQQVAVSVQDQEQAAMVISREPSIETAELEEDQSLLAARAKMQVEEFEQEAVNRDDDVDDDDDDAEEDDHRLLHHHAAHQPRPKPELVEPATDSLVARMRDIVEGGGGGGGGSQATTLTMATTDSQVSIEKSGRSRTSGNHHHHHHQHQHGHHHSSHQCTRHHGHHHSSHHHSHSHSHGHQHHGHGHAHHHHHHHHHHRGHQHSNSEQAHRSSVGAMSATMSPSLAAKDSGQEQQHAASTDGCDGQQQLGEGGASKSHIHSHRHLQEQQQRQKSVSSGKLDEQQASQQQQQQQQQQQVAAANTTTSAAASESKSSTSSVSSATHQRQHTTGSQPLQQDQSANKEGAGQAKRMSVQMSRCPVHPGHQRPHNHNHGHHHHHHQHAHHHHHHHRRAHKRRHERDTTASDKLQSGETLETSGVAGSDESGGQRVALQDISAQSNQATTAAAAATCCPHHEHQCRHGVNARAHHHHHSSHQHSLAHSHHHHHHHHHGGSGDAGDQEQSESLDGKQPLGSGGDQLVGAAGSRGVGSHHHHHHHHHSHAGHRHSHSHQGTSKQQPQQQQQQLQLARQNRQKMSSSKTNLPDGCLAGGDPSTDLKSANLTMSDDENKMHLDEQQQNQADSVVKMEMSPTSDGEGKTLATSAANRLAKAENQNAITSIELISSPKDQLLEQRTQVGAGSELAAVSKEQVAKQRDDNLIGQAPTMGRNSSLRERPNGTNGEQKVGTSNEGGHVNGSQHDDQLVRQMSSSRENSKKSQQSRQNVTSGSGDGSGNNRSQQHQQPGGSGAGGSNGDDDHYAIERASKQQDQHSTASNQQASQPKQIIESSVPVDRRCRLCWCCCCPCSALSNNRSVTNGNSKLEQQKPSGDVAGLSNNKCGQALANVSLEEVRAWGDSFDRLMKCPEGRKVFQDFLRCEYSEENILFWIACEELKGERDSKSIASKARDIYEDYISILSAKEVSLDSRVRDIINNNIKKPTSNIFDEAQLQIYTLMHRDSYPRFINSPMYKKLAKIQTTSRKSSS